MDFARQQAVATVAVEKYEEKALIEALGRYVLGGEVIKPPTPEYQSAIADKLTKPSREEKMDLDPQNKEKGKQP